MRACLLCALLGASFAFGQDFSFTVTPDSRSVAAGSSTTFGASITSINGFNGVVPFSVSGLPSGVTASFNPTTVTGSGSTTLTINTSSNGATGSFFPIISAASGTLGQNISVSLDITTTSANAPPFARSVVPNSGSGSAQILTFEFSDPNGATDIVSTQMDINAQLSAANACYFYYSRASNALYLANNAGAWQGPVTLGTAGVGLSNSQCSVDPEDSLVSDSGNTLALSLAIGFQTAFAGAKSIFMEVQNATQDSGWWQMGIWTATAGPAPDFMLGTSPGSENTAPGASASYAITVTALNGFSGVVSFGASGLPSGATASFNPTTVTGTGSTALTVNTSSSGGTGSFTIGVTGTSGALSHNTSASLGIISGSANMPPEPASVTPNTGSGSSQTFEFAFSDLNGATDIVSAQMDISAQLSATNACYFYYSRASNALYLANNAGAWQGPVTVGGSGTLSNSQCTVNAGGSSVSASGITLTLSLAVTFTAGFIGAKNVYMEVQNATQDSGWSAQGTWTVTSGGSLSPDFSLGMTAGPGSIAAGGSAQYTVAVTGVNGFSGTVSFGTSGLPAGVTGSFNPITVTGSGSTTLTIMTTSDASQGGFTITVTGTSGSLSHNATASLTITGASSGGPPAPLSVAPNTGSGSSGTFAFAFSDPNGATDILSTQMDIGATLSATGACYFYYARGANALYLATDAGAWQGPLTIGSAGTLQNSQCTVNAGASSVLASGNTLTLSLALTFTAGFTGAKNVYMEVQNVTQNSGWSAHGTWTVSSSGESASPPEPVSVTPNTGSGLSDTFAFVFSDGNGATDIVSTQMDIGATLSATGACYFYYGRGANALYLASDTGAWQGPVTIGSSGTLANSQCSVNAGTSSMSVSGNTLTLNLAVSFNAGFAGAKNIYMEVQNATVDSGWSLHGGWTVP
jgi:hypothetical protein